jgi:hypothetical protein
LLPRRTLADQIADDHQPGGDPDASLEFDRFDVEPADKRARSITDNSAR